MSRRQILLLLSLFTFFLTCEKDSPYIPESYKLLPQSDVPIIASDWHCCSIPISPGKDLQSRSQLFWWNPYEQVAIKEIWSTIEVSPDVPNRIHVLDLFFIPNKNLSSPEDSWNGVILYLSDEFRNQFDSFQYVEVTIKGDNGIIHFDLGEISEDVIPNGELDSEDIPINGIRNGILDAGEDIGIDGMAGTDPADWWDVNGNGFKDQGEPISYDDFRYSTGSPDSSKINGIEGNRRLDTEDLNFNNILDTLNNYYEYSINLDKSSSDTILINPSLPTSKGYGWNTYRIDLSNPTTIVGNPDPLKLKFFRIWFDGVTNQAPIRIATIDFK